MIWYVPTTSVYKSILTSYLISHFFKQWNIKAFEKNYLNYPNPLKNWEKILKFCALAPFYLVKKWSKNQNVSDTSSAISRWVYICSQWDNRVKIRQKIPNKIHHQNIMYWWKNTTLVSLMIEGEGRGLIKCFEWKRIKTS